MSESSFTARRQVEPRRAVIGDPAERKVVTLRGMNIGPATPFPARVDQQDSATQDEGSTESLGSIWGLRAPVAVVMDFIGIGLSQYDDLMLDISGEGSALPGCLFHWAASTPDGVRATEVWRNLKLFDFFLREEVLPTVSALRLPDPELTVYAVHHFLTEGRLQSLET
jgi:hypothetical protein